MPGRDSGAAPFPEELQAKGEMLRPGTTPAKAPRAGVWVLTGKLLRSGALISYLGLCSSTCLKHLLCETYALGPGVVHSKLALGGL